MQYIKLKKLTQKKQVLCGLQVFFYYSTVKLPGGFLLGKGIGKNKFLWGLALGAAYFILLMILSGIAVPGSFGGAGRLFATLLLCCAGGMAGGMLA